MDAEVILRTEGKAGRIRLNRPKAIHALNTGMCAAMLGALTAWRDDPAVEIVLIDHAEGRGFCAGGDIRMIATSGAGDGSQARDFFRVEYRLNHALFTYVKPVVAFMDGITMGGGVGISQPARYRVATENTRFAMPETGIGLFPDVGGGWYLSRLASPPIICPPPRSTGPRRASPPIRHRSNRFSPNCRSRRPARRYAPSKASSTGSSPPIRWKACLPRSRRMAANGPPPSSRRSAPNRPSR